jgi:hypothetical protein
MVKKTNTSIGLTRDRVNLGSNSVQPIEFLVWPTSELRLHSSQSSFEVEIVKERQPITLSESSESSLTYRRKVRFSGSDETFIIINRKDISSTERRNTWYRKSELRKANCGQDEVEAQLHDNVIDGRFNDWAWENQLMTTLRDELLECQKSFHRLMTISSVLEEQNRQKKIGIHNPVLVFKTYKDAIRRSRHALFISSLSSQEKERKRQKMLCLDALREANRCVRSPKRKALKLNACPFLYTNQALV